MKEMLDIDPRLQKMTKVELLELVVILDGSNKFTDLQLSVARCASALRNGRLMMKNAAAEAKPLENRKGMAARRKLHTAYSKFARGEKMYQRGQRQWKEIKSNQVTGSG